MRFGWAKVRNVRRLSDVSLAFHPGLNLIVGDNAAGKTTLLECLQILSRGSGVRGKPASLVTHGVDRWSISASLPTYSEAEDHVRVSWIDRSMTATINDQRVGRADLARRAPVLSMSPQSHRLLEEGPGLRRRYLDWGVFHMEPLFFPSWTRLVRALSQRNAALRSKRTLPEVASWNPELAVAAETITVFRRQYVDALQPIWQGELRAMSETRSWSLRLQPGWKGGQSYEETLSSSYARDLRQGFTVEGPHRAELQVLLDGRVIRDEISRGQQKLVIAALILAQGKLYQASHGVLPALLVDDVAAELSENSRRLIQQRLESYSGQRFVTGLDAGTFADYDPDHAMFHVEQGRFTRLN